MEFFIQQVSIEYSEILSSIHSYAFSQEESWTVKEFRELLGIPGTYVWLVSDGKIPVGFIMTRFILDEGEILTLAVLPSARRCGVARRLLGVVIDTASNKGADLFLEVAVTNIPAIGLYESLGFEEIGYRSNYYENGMDARVLRLGRG